MKKLGTFLALVLTIGFVNAQQTSQAVTQKVDVKLSNLDKTVALTADQKTELRPILVKYVSLIEEEKNSVGPERGDKEAMRANIENHKTKMMEEVFVVLNDDQDAKLEAELKKNNQKK